MRLDDGCSDCYGTTDSKRNLVVVRVSIDAHRSHWVFRPRVGAIARLLPQLSIDQTHTPGLGLGTQFN